jgi:hypothetical protein
MDIFHAFLNFFSLKQIVDVLSLVGWVLVSTALVYGLELAGLPKLLTRIGYWNADDSGAALIARRP